MVKTEGTQTPSQPSSAKRKKADELESNGTKKKPRTRVRSAAIAYS